MIDAGNASILGQNGQMFDDIKLNSLVKLLTEVGPDTRIYLGCDSVRLFRNNKSMAKFATVCIVHKNGNNGCRIFSNTSYENDYDLRPNRPKMRMINEAKKVSELYLQLAPLIDEFPIEIHLDVNTDPTHGSNCAASEAAGYVLGMTGIVPKLKPDGFAASYGADGVAHGRAA